MAMTGLGFPAPAGFGQTPRGALVTLAVWVWWSISSVSFQRHFYPAPPAPDGAGLNNIAIEHPQVKIYVNTKVNDKDGEVTNREQATLERHARRLLAGEVDVPGSLRAGQN